MDSLNMAVSQWREYVPRWTECMFMFTQETYLFTATIMALLGTTIFIWKLISGPSHDSREPPLIKPTIPLFGHVLGMVTQRMSYFSTIYERHKVPIATLPFPGKANIYVIFSAHMQQIAMRSSSMVANERTVELIPRLFGVKKKTLLAWLGRDGIHEDMTPSMVKLFGSTLTGDSLNDMTLKSLDEISDILNGIGETGLHIDNLFMWLRYHVSHAVSVAMFGKRHNPYGNSTEVIDGQWDFEADLGPLVLGFLPAIMARRGYLGRAKVHEALRPYYEGNHDEEDEVSDLVKARGQLFRKWDTPVDQLCKNEISIMLASTTNTVPTMFWYIAHVWTTPGLVEELRAEVAPTIPCLLGPDGIRKTPPPGTKEITINFTKLDPNCPLLASCYREVIRLASQILTFRRVDTDMVIKDSDGTSYLLKAGNDVIIPAKVVHRNRDTWGQDAEGFNPRRFLPDPSGNREIDKLRKISFVPFGGGRHYCPGRNFASSENVSVMAALVLGFEVEGLDKDNLRMEDSKMGQAAKPVAGHEGGPCVIRRRRGWEHVEWKFAK
ncbi:cytochrome P450 [Coniochaeta sp. 2T2.1]|nr:cytochrome P450 [Coniochaeta sp. 2T2.1]